MKLALVSLILCLVALFSVKGQEPFKAPAILPPDSFDKWGDIPFEDEKIHLDKIANQAKEWSLSIIYLVVHAGQKACAGEAKARGIRSKEYLVSRGVEPERIVPIDAGWRKKVSVEVWIWPPQLGRPKPDTDLDLKASKVSLQRNCRIRYRGN